MKDKPRFNHVAMSVPADLLDEQGRADILAFYNEVFDWSEAPGQTIDRKRLVLLAYEYDQFVFLIAEDEPMKAPRLDHFGMRVHDLDDLDEMLAKAKAYKEKDDRVDIVDKTVEDYEVLKIHSFYVGYRLPMMVEVQYWEMAAS
jgi:hypothetical protein